MGILERELPRVHGARRLLIPGCAETCDHGTAAFARFYRRALHERLQTAPRLAP